IPAPRVQPGFHDREEKMISVGEQLRKICKFVGSHGRELFRWTAVRRATNNAFAALPQEDPARVPCDTERPTRSTQGAGRPSTAAGSLQRATAEEHQRPAGWRKRWAINTLSLPAGDSMGDEVGNRSHEEPRALAERLVHDLPTVRRNREDLRS